ncbi:MAG: helix-turn-helix transcriptional regulator [Alphaproteobacteria bacterium]|nr:helix-turn-helix transcriptional regulator [Alphaproteobacteria bacterium]
MKMKAQPANNIKALSESRGISARQLAKMIGTSAPHMSRLINGKSPLKQKWLLKISAALKVPVSKIVEAEPERAHAAMPGRAYPRKRPSVRGGAQGDLPGSIIGWLLEADEEIKAGLTRQDLSKLTSFIYKEAVETPLNANDARYLAFMAVRVKQLIGSTASPK